MPGGPGPATGCAAWWGMEAKVNIFDMIGKRMEWLSQRQRVLAGNIANADTPEYVPLDIKDNLFKRILRRQISR